MGHIRSLGRGSTVVGHACVRSLIYYEAAIAGKRRRRIGYRRECYENHCRSGDQQADNSSKPSARIGRI